MSSHSNRRQWLTSTAALGTGLILASQSRAKESASSHFRLCLNTSTLRGHRLTLEQEVEIAAKAGYQGIEPLIRESSQVGGKAKIKELAKKIRDLGLTIESAIGFANWIVDDDTNRRKGLEQAKKDMDLVRQLGGSRIAAPPTGATRQENLDLRKAAERYHALLKVGDGIGVVPQIEVWGFSKSLSKLGEAVFVAVESGHPKACILPDIYHLYKGGNSFHGLKLLSGQSMHCFHVNDYPAKPGRETISDRDRVHVGDGVAPVKEIFQTLATNGFKGALSLELFNPTYWKQDPLKVATEGLEKIKKAVQSLD